jgi:curved DNA-binding protein
MEFKDYYKILGVDRHADQKTISKTFRRLAREHHPDVNKAKGAEDRFKGLNEAYQALGDPAKRAKYDQLYDAYKSGGVPWQDLLGRMSGQPGWGSGPGGVTFEVGNADDFEQLFGRSGFSDFFQGLFGGLGGTGGPGGPGRPAATRRPRARVETTTEIALEEVLHGARRQIQFSGGKRVDVEIPRGIRSGQTMRLAGAADGRDVFLTVHVAPHRLFERTDEDLHIEVPITVSEAALGGEIEVPTLDGTVKMRVPSETQSGRRFRLKGLGLPKHSAAGGTDGRGDVYVRVKIVVPAGLSEHERKLFEELGKARRENPRAALLA